MFQIYLLVNLINGKIYVGQTSVGVNARWRQHLYSADCQDPKPLYRAIRKYGKDNFKISVVETPVFREDLDHLETEWITKLNSTDPSVGYNLTTGGQSGFRFSPESNSNKRHDLPVEEMCYLCDQGWSATEIARKFNVYYSTIIRRLEPLGKKFKTNDQTLRKERLIAEGKEHLLYPNNEELVRLYNSGKEVPELSELFELAKRNIRKRLTKSGVVIRIVPSWKDGLRICIRCQIPKPIEEIIKNKARYSGLGSYCRPCFQAYTKERKAIVSAVADSQPAVTSEVCV